MCDTNASASSIRRRNGGVKGDEGQVHRSSRSNSSSNRRGDMDIVSLLSWNISVACLVVTGLGVLAYWFFPMDDVVDAHHDRPVNLRTRGSSTSEGSQSQCTIWNEKVNNCKIHAISWILNTFSLHLWLLYRRNLDGTWFPSPIPWIRDIHYSRHPKT
jgi:hypothetical protein